MVVSLEDYGTNSYNRYAMSLHHGHNVSVYTRSESYIIVGWSSKVGFGLELQQILDDFLYQ